jgi:WD40 repeat protein
MTLSCFLDYKIQIPSGELKRKLVGHFSLVYDMCWSRKDTHLLSASADGTVRYAPSSFGQPQTLSDFDLKHL